MNNTEMEYEKILKLVNSFNSAEYLTKKQKEQRIKYFNVWNNPDIIGPTKCPYDSPEYCALNCPILLTKEIDRIIKCSNDLDALTYIAMSLGSGAETIKDIYAAKRIYEFIREEARKTKNMDAYLWTNIHLGELLALPIGFGNPRKAMPYFQEDYELIMNNSANELGIDEHSYSSIRYWPAMCLAFCFESFGQQEKADEMYRSVTRDLSEGIDLYAIFIRIINKVRSIIAPQPKQLEISADELEKAIKEVLKRNGGKKHSGFAKFEGQVKNWRERARILRQSTAEKEKLN
jgi:hypothetical protein